MKKLLLWSAIAAVCGAAQAQSSLTLYGIVDVGIQRTSAGGVGHVVGESNGGLSTSRLGFRGVEDLGGGWSAGFWLEGSLNPDVGTGRATNTNNQASGAVLPAAAGQPGLIFDRLSYASIAGPIGEFRFGHDFVPNHYNSIYFDPFNANGVARAGNFTFAGAGPGSLFTGITASNSISYWLPPKLGGFYGMAMVALGENLSTAPNSKDGDLAGMRVGYAAGPFDVAAAVTRTRYLATATLGNYTHANIGGTWNIGPAKLFALYNRVTVQLAGGEVRKNTAEIGAHIPVGAVSRIRVSYLALNDSSEAGLRNGDGSAVSANDARQIGVGYVYDLSKRSGFYGTYARLKNRGQATYAVSGGRAPLPGQTSSGLEVGFRHTF